MDRDIVYFTKGRISTLRQCSEDIIAAFKGLPFANQMQEAVFAFNRTDAALDKELAATTANTQIVAALRSTLSVWEDSSIITANDIDDICDAFKERLNTVDRSRN